MPCFTLSQCLIYRHFGWRADWRSPSWIFKCLFDAVTVYPPYEWYNIKYLRWGYDDSCLLSRSSSSIIAIYVLPHLFVLFLQRQDLIHQGGEFGLGSDEGFMYLRCFFFHPKGPNRKSETLSDDCSRLFRNGRFFILRSLLWAVEGDRNRWCIFRLWSSLFCTEYSRNLSLYIIPIWLYLAIPI